MREAARALDDVSDHLGEVLRHADELLTEWSRFGAQVRAQVEHEAGAIGAVVDDAVARAAGSGIDRAIADRLSALTTEIGKLEARTKAAARAAAEQRDTDRRALWIVAAGVVLANVLLVALWLRKPDAPPPPAPEPVKVEPAAAAAPTAEPAPPDGVSSAAAPTGASTAAAGAPAAAGANAAAAGTPAADAKDAAKGAPAADVKDAAKGAAAKDVVAKDAAAKGTREAAPKASQSPIVIQPPKHGAPVPHKKLP